MSIKNRIQPQTTRLALRESDSTEPSDDESVSNPARERASPARAAPETMAALSQIESVPGYRPRRPPPTLQESASAAQPHIQPPVLDAWYADFVGPIVGSLLATTQALIQKASLTTEIWEVVIGQDDRFPVHLRGFPWRCICSLLITAADGSLWNGTGWLAGPRTVMTAGHCVYIHERGGWVKSIQVTPGRDVGYRPYGTCFSHTFRSVWGWTERQKRENDYGAIFLPPNVPYGSRNRNGSFGYEALPDTDLRGLIVNIAGYPADKQPPGMQWFHSRSVGSVTPRTLLYDIDTAPGQSGAPVWCMIEGKRYVVGIHTNGDLSGNSATRIADPVFDNISAWVDEAGR